MLNKLTAALLFVCLALLSCGVSGKMIPEFAGTTMTQMTSGVQGLTVQDDYDYEMLVFKGHWRKNGSTNAAPSGLSVSEGKTYFQLTTLPGLTPNLTMSSNYTVFVALVAVVLRNGEYASSLAYESNLLGLGVSSSAETGSEGTRMVLLANVFDVTNQSQTFDQLLSRIVTEKEGWTAKELLALKSYLASGDLSIEAINSVMYAAWGLSEDTAATIYNDGCQSRMELLASSSDILAMADSSMEATIISTGLATGACHKFQVLLDTVQPVNATDLFLPVVVYCMVAWQLYSLTAKTIKRQLTEFPARNDFVSLISLVMQVVLDTFLCLFHFLVAQTVVMADLLLGIAYFTVPIAQFIVVSTMLMNWTTEVRHRSQPEETPQQRTRRDVVLYMVIFACTWTTTELLSLDITFPVFTTLLFVYYSWWVPQIIKQIVTNKRQCLDKTFMLTTALSRLLVPVYWFSTENFLEVKPVGSSTSIALVFWVLLQLAVLVVQEVYGARCFVPNRVAGLYVFPEPYNYHRVRPAIIAKQAQQVTPTPVPGSDDASDIELSILHDEESENDALLSVNLVDGKLATQDANLSNTFSINFRSLNTTTSLGTSTSPNADVTAVEEQEEELCSICLCDFTDVTGLLEVMVTPCNHSYHTPCLSTWMQQRLECPTCRGTLPAIETE